MPNPIANFAIHADDVERARSFYTKVFGWEFQPWGPPGFYLIRTGPGEVGGSLHARHEPLSGAGMRGFECTVAVEDLDAIITRVQDSGGEVLSQPFTIPGVGTVVSLRDPEGNALAAMHYDANCDRDSEFPS